MTRMISGGIVNQIHKLIAADAYDERFTVGDKDVRVIVHDGSWLAWTNQYPWTNPDPPFGHISFLCAYGRWVHYLDGHPSREALETALSIGVLTDWKGVVRGG